MQSETEAGRPVVPVQADVRPAPPIECTYCGENLDDEERDSPSADSEGDVMCDSCYDDKYRDNCQRCMETEDKDQLDTKPGAIIAVWNTAPGGGSDVEPGYYRVVSWPIYADGMIEGHLFPSSLQRVADLDDKGRRAAAGAWFLAGPMCQQCRAEVAALMPPNA